MGFKLLLADDSITIQKVVSIIFSGEEYELTIVNSGTGALEKAAAIVPDVMLVDTLMPGASGYEVCEKIRQDAALRNIPILLLTGAFEPFNVEKARESGADDFISKPFESQVLIEKVKGLIELGKERQVAPAVPVPPEVPPEEPVWSFDASLAAEPIAPASSAVSGFSPVTAPENVWDTNFQADAAMPLQTEQPATEQWAPAPEEQPEDLAWQLEPTAGGTEFAETDAFSSEMPAPDNARPEEVIEVSPDDDLWGAFELEPVEESAVDPVDILEAYAVETDEPDVAEEAFPPLEGPGYAVEIPAVSQAAPEPVGAEDDFFFGQNNYEPAVSPFAGEDSSSADAVEEFESTVAETAFEPAPGTDEAFSLGQAAAADAGYFFSETATPVPDTETATAEPAVEAVLQAAEEPPASETEESAVFAATGGESSAVTLDEHQLAAVISQISREVIEKVVWEVVPDLAEILIKEEIRKIKEGR